MADVELDVTFESSNVSLDTDFGTVYVIDGNTAVKVIANKYSSDRTYAVDEYVIHESLLYRCITAIDAPEEFDSEKWLNIKLADDVKNIKSALDTKANASDLTNKMDKDNPRGTGSFAVGGAVTASGAFSHAEGFVTTAKEKAAHAEGINSVAWAEASHAEGYQTNAMGKYSHSEGKNTIAYRRSQHVFGEYNITDDEGSSVNDRGEYIEIAGNGTSNNPSNARTLDWDGNETLAGDLTFNGDKSLTSEISRLDGRITDLPEAMVFKGTLGVNGDIQTLPTASAEIEGWTFKCITAGTYAGLTLKVGDSVTCFNPPNTSVYEWDISGYGDTDTDTWRSIKINGEDALGSGISSGSVDFVGSENIEVEFDSNGNKVGVKTKNIYTKAQVDDIVYGILPDDTASGSVANFETDLALPVKSLEIDVNAKQDLHGEANPYPAGGGINKWNEEWELGSYSSVNGSAINYTDRIRCKNAIPVLPSTSYCIRFGTTASCVVNAYDENGDFIENLSTGTFGTGGRVITTPANCYFIKFSVGTAYGTTYNNDISVNYPSTDTEYHPYSNICPISGWSEISVVHCGKNLFNSSIYDGYKQTDGTYRGQANSLLGMKTYLGDFIGKQITFSAFLDLTVSPAPTNAKVGAKINGVDVYGNNINSGNTGYSTLTITPQTENDYINLSFGSGGTNSYTFYNLQLEIGNARTEYTDFVTPITEVINLGGTYYGGHFTQDKDGQRQFKVTHGIKLFGDISFSRSNNGGAWGAYLFYALISDKTNGGVLKCSNYEYVVQATSTMQNEKIISVGSSKYIYVRDDAYTTVADFKTANANTQLVYPLATPIIIDLPDGEPIITLNGTNNIYADSGDASVEFAMSIKDYIDKEIASVQALILNS